MFPLQFQFLWGGEGGRTQGCVSIYLRGRGGGSFIRAALESAVCSALGTVPDRHSPKLVLLYAGLLYYYSYGHIIQAVCMRAVQWLYLCVLCCG